MHCTVVTFVCGMGGCVNLVRCCVRLSDIHASACWFAWHGIFHLVFLKTSSLRLLSFPPLETLSAFKMALGVCCLSYQYVSSGRFGSQHRIFISWIHQHQCVSLLLSLTLCGTFAASGYTFELWNDTWSVLRELPTFFIWQFWITAPHFYTHTPASTSTHHPHTTCKCHDCTMHNALRLHNA